MEPIEAIASVGRGNEKSGANSHNELPENLPLRLVPLLESLKIFVPRLHRTLWADE